MSKNSNSWSQALGEGDGCPSLDQLIDGTAGKLGEAAQREAAAHVAGCAHCETELAMFRQFQDPAVRPEEKADVEAIVERLKAQSPVEHIAWWKPIFTMRWIAPASLALAAVLIGITMWTPGRPASGPDVSGIGDGMRSARVTVVAPIGFVQNAPRQLEWVAVKDAVRYQVTLSEVDHTQVWNITVDGASAALPAEVAAKIVPLKTFLWQVSAIDRNGAVLAGSGAQRFRLEKRPAQ